MDNLFEDVPERLAEEWIEVLAEGRSVRVERIVSDGHSSPEDFWYDQDEHEWVLVVEGAAELVVQEEGGTKKMGMKRGDHILIPAHQKHRVESTVSGEKTIWLAVFFGDE